jgi:hypothetical protein
MLQRRADEHTAVLLEALMKHPVEKLILASSAGGLFIAGYRQDSSRIVNLQLWNWRGIDVINAHEHDRTIHTQGMAPPRKRWRRARLSRHISIHTVLRSKTRRKILPTGIPA